MTLLAAQTVGTAGSGAASTVVLTGGLLAAANTKLITAAVALITIATGVVVYKNSFHGPADVVPPPSPTREDHRPVNRSIPTQPQELPPEAEPESVDVASAVEPVSTVESAPVLEVAESQVAPPEDEAASKKVDLDLSRPETTVCSFIKAIVAGDTESVLACMSSDSGDYKVVQETLAAGPDDPQVKDEYEMKLFLQSFDPDAEMPILSLEQTGGGRTSIFWQVTFKREATSRDRTFHAGDTFEMRANLRQIDGSWLIRGYLIVSQNRKPLGRGDVRRTRAAHFFVCRET